jgi:hypothetical protein
MVDRLDEERTEILRAWATGLAMDSREELRAAGTAITMLINEIERLRIEARHARETGSPSLAGRSTEKDQQEAVDAVSSQSLGTSLRERLGTVIPSRTTYGRD